MSVAKYWIELALEANRLDFTVPEGASKPSPEHGGPTLSSRALAIALLSMHDAYFSVRQNNPGPGTAQTWLTGLTPPAEVPSGSDADAAAALGSAALAALRGLYHSPAHVKAFNDAESKQPVVTGASIDARFWGAEVAQKVLAARAGDLDFSGTSTPPAPGKFRHRNDPFHRDQSLHGQHWGGCAPYAVPRQALAEPPVWAGAAAPDTTFYETELDDVLKKGALNDHNREPDETVAGIFWAYDGADKIGTPPRLYCQIALGILSKAGATEADYVRTLGLIGAAMADAGIQAWYWKYHYDLWRPVVGIREVDSSLGPQEAILTAGRPVTAKTDWAPLGAPATNRGDRFTPPFPAYPSGHATFGAAAFQVLRRYMETRGLADTRDADEPDAIAFDFVSDEYNGANVDPDGSVRPQHLRKFESLWAATVENSLSRVYLGVHWRFDGITRQGATGEAEHAGMGVARPGDLGNVGGVWLGKTIADYLMDNGLAQP